VKLTAVVMLALVGSLVRPSASNSFDGCTPRTGDVRFQAADGAHLVGHLFGTGKRAVVLIHQSRGDMCEWLSYAERLSKLGYTAFTIDLRGYGESQLSGLPPAIRYGGDAIAAVRYLVAHGETDVFLLGASQGGSVALDAAANMPRIKGVISVSGAADLVDAIRAVKRVRQPSLFIAGRDDVDFANDAKRLFDASAARDKTLDIVPSGLHGTQLVGGTPNVRSAIEKFLAGH
jgi:pimeloyl-ACP methyl ester carboxylesterase